MLMLECSAGCPIQETSHTISSIQTPGHAKPHLPLPFLQQLSHPGTSPSQPFADLATLISPGRGTTQGEGGPQWVEDTVLPTQCSISDGAASSAAS